MPVKILKRAKVLPIFSDINNMVCFRKIKRNMTKRAVSLFVAGATVFCALNLPVYSSAADLTDIENEQQETQEAIDSIAAKKKKAEKKADKLQDEADALNEELNTYTAKLNEVNARIEKAQGEIDNVSADIDTLEEELKTAKADEKVQYDAMKDRIQYFYERNAGRNLITVFLECGSLTDFVNALTYLDSVLAYDREMLESYQKLEQTIEEKTAKLEESKANLNDKKKELSASQREMDDLVGAKAAEASEAEDVAESASMTVEEYDRQLALLDQKMVSLEADAAAAQAALAQQIAAQQAAADEAARQAAEAAAAAENGGENGEDGNNQTGDTTAPAVTGQTGGPVAASASDVALIAATVMAEAGNQAYNGKLAVASVIANRINSPLFPNSAYGVITQERQFASWRSGKVSFYLENQSYTEECYQAAQAVVNGTRNGDWLFFMTKAAADGFGIKNYEQIQDHVFFVKWETY